MKTIADFAAKFLSADPMTQLLVVMGLIMIALIVMAVAVIFTVKLITSILDRRDVKAEAQDQKLEQQNKANESMNAVAMNALVEMSKTSSRALDRLAAVSERSMTIDAEQIRQMSTQTAAIQRNSGLIDGLRGDTTKGVSVLEEHTKVLQQHIARLNSIQDDVRTLVNMPGQLTELTQKLDPVIADWGHIKEGVFNLASQLRDAEDTLLGVLTDISNTIKAHQPTLLGAAANANAIPADGALPVDMPPKAVN